MLECLCIVFSTHGIMIQIIIIIIMYALIFGIMNIIFSVSDTLIEKSVKIQHVTFFSIRMISLKR